MRYSLQKGKNKLKSKCVLWFDKIALFKWWFPEVTEMNH